MLENAWFQAQRRLVHPLCLASLSYPAPPLAPDPPRGARRRQQGRRASGQLTAVGRGGPLPRPLDDSRVRNGNHTGSKSSGFIALFLRARGVSQYHPAIRRGLTARLRRLFSPPPSQSNPAMPENARFQAQRRLVHPLYLASL